MVESLTIERCRNFDSREFRLFPRTIITGANGVGKSTILEAIRVLSVGKSFRTGRLDELIRFDERHFRLEALINRQQKVEFFYGSQFELSEGRDRQLTYQGNSIAWTDFLGAFPTVLFTPNDMEIVLGSPDVRRRYLDSVLWQVDPNYRQSQLEFAKGLREKAALLFMVKINRASPDELTPWNALMTGLTEVIRAARLRYIAYLNDSLASRLKGQDAKITIKYQADPRPAEEMINQEIKTAQNLYGAHRDEMMIEFDAFSARRYASRGQSRLVVAYLKAAEADYLRERTQNPVTVLLDDAMSELDNRNTRKLLELFQPDHQLILTSAATLDLPKDWETIKL